MRNNRAKWLIIGGVALTAMALVVGTLCGLTALAVVSSGAHPALMGDSCGTSRPPSGGYSITLCITDPIEDATIHGATPVAVAIAFAGAHPAIHQLFYSLGDASHPADLASDGTFTLLSDQFGDGSYQLRVWAQMDDGFVSDPAGVAVVLSNGVVATQDGSTPTPGDDTPAPAPTLGEDTPAAAPTLILKRAARPAATGTPDQTAEASVPTDVAPATDPGSNTGTTDTTGATVDSGSSTTSSCMDSVVGTVWADGTGVPGVDVKLNDGSGAQVAESKTDSSTGQYAFADLPDGSYSVVVTLPAGFTATSTTANVNVSNCSVAQQNFALSGGPATVTPTGTLTVTPTATGSAMITATTTTAAPTATGTITTTAPTATPTPTSAPGATKTGTATPTARAGSGSGATGTPTRTATPAPRLRSTPTPSRTPARTPTLRSTPAPSQTPTRAPTASRQPTRTPTPEASATRAPTRRPTPTATPTRAPVRRPASTPTSTPTRTPVRGATPIRGSGNVVIVAAVEPDVNQETQ